MILTLYYLFFLISRTIAHFDHMNHNLISKIAIVFLTHNGRQDNDSFGLILPPFINLSYFC